MLKRVVCVEDSEEYQILIKKALSGFDLTFCGSISAARTSLIENSVRVDLIILDVSLPDGNGIEFLSELRSYSRLAEIPIFILSVDSAVLNKVAAFGVGVDDYIVKPFDPIELRARIEARIKKVEESKSKLSQREIGDLLLDQSRMQVRFGDRVKEKIEFTPIEFKILFLLSRRPEVIYSRQQIIDEVWGPSTYITDRTVDAHVSHIRQKMQPSKVSIKTVLGVGYKLTIQET